MLELTVQEAERVFVFVHGTKNGISRLSPGTCSTDGDALADTPSRYRYEFPAERFQKQDWPTVYAIAVNGQHLGRRLEQHLGQLPDACKASAGLTADGNMAPWLSRLDRMIANNHDNAVWMARRIP